MPRIKLTKTAIDELPIPPCDLVYWDAALPGFGVKVTPKGRKVFILLYRTGGAEAPEVYDRRIPRFTAGGYTISDAHAFLVQGHQVNRIDVALITLDWVIDGIVT